MKTKLSIKQLEKLPFFTVRNDRNKGNWSKTILYNDNHIGKIDLVTNELYLDENINQNTKQTMIKKMKLVNMKSKLTIDQIEEILHYSTDDYFKKGIKQEDMLVITLVSTVVCTLNISTGNVELIADLDGPTEDTVIIDLELYYP